MAKNGTTGGTAPKPSTSKKPQKRIMYYYDSDGYESEVLDAIFGRDGDDDRPTPSLSYASLGSMRNIPYRPSRWDSLLDSCTRCLTPFALCSMGKNPFMLIGKRKYRRYRVSSNMDEYLKERIARTQESGKVAMMNQNEVPKAAHETGTKTD